jgi:hypothetical protein
VDARDRDHNRSATQSGITKIALIDVTTNTETSAKYLDPHADIANAIALILDGKGVASSLQETASATFGRSRSTVRAVIG